MSTTASRNASADASDDPGHRPMRVLEVCWSARDALPTGAAGVASGLSGRAVDPGHDQAEPYRACCRPDEFTTHRGRYDVIVIARRALQQGEPFPLMGGAYALLEPSGVVACPLDGEAAPLASLARRCGLGATPQQPIGLPLAVDAAEGLTLLRRLPEGRWRVAALRAEHRPAVLALFRAVFGSGMPPALWRWKYEQGRGQSVVVWRGERIVAHYGGMTRPIRFFGRPAQAVQIGDVMVEPGERGVVTRSGPFFLSCASFLESYIGYGTRHLLGFGFPSHRHMRLAERLGLYAAVDSIVEVGWALSTVRPGRLSLRPLSAWACADDQAMVDDLWREMADDLRGGIVGVRDWGYLRRRYLLHPTKLYHVMAVYRSRAVRALGIIVLRRDAARWELLDVIAPLRHVPELVEASRWVARQRGGGELYTWVTQSHSEPFVGSRGRRRHLDVYVPTNVWHEGPSPEHVRGRWWLTGGDTDFH